MRDEERPPLSRAETKVVRGGIKGNGSRQTPLSEELSEKRTGKLVKFLPAFRRWLRHRQIAFDTSFLISVLEDSRREDEIIARVFGVVEKRSLLLVTSTVTLLEVLVRPYREGDIDTVGRWFIHLTRAPFIKLSPLTANIADRAAEMRAKYGFKTPDAIQLATALEEGTTLFLTRDRGFRKQTEIEVGIL